MYRCCACVFVRSLPPFPTVKVLRLNIPFSIRQLQRLVVGSQKPLISCPSTFSKLLSTHAARCSWNIWCSCWNSISTENKSYEREKKVKIDAFSLIKIVLAKIRTISRKSFRYEKERKKIAVDFNFHSKERRKKNVRNANLEAARIHCRFINCLVEFCRWVWA